MAKIRKSFEFTHSFTQKRFCGFAADGKAKYANVHFPVKLTGTATLNPQEPRGTEDRYSIDFDAALDPSGADLFPFIEFQDSAELQEVTEAAIRHAAELFEDQLQEVDYD